MPSVLNQDLWCFLVGGYWSEFLQGKGRYRCLSKDYEQLPQVSEAFVYAAMTRLMLRRLTFTVKMT
ncbi:hypothetical protein [Funiculus sociatus]|uniref:hypothetical protein n=1 Tax=Funiculus sociatus TaxID=450527 RepID=UPI0019A7F65F|nr:hypothetical protein [Trichocoleus sp. FACHB-69]